MKDTQFAKLVLAVNGLVPLGLLGWDAYDHHLGANPIEFAIHTTGKIALIFLMLSLMITPLRKITGWNYWSNFRRMLGLFAFFYALLHLFLYVGLDRQFDLRSTLNEIIKRRYILYGMSALLMMVPLAITSTNGMIKRLGAARWKRLHQLVYPAAIAAVIHYWKMVKADTTGPMEFAVVLGILLGFRLVVAAKRKLAASSPGQ